MLVVVDVEYFTIDGVEYQKEIYSNGATVTTPVPQPIEPEPIPEPEPTQLDRIEEAINKSNEQVAQEAIDAYTLELIEGGVL